MNLPQALRIHRAPPLVEISLDRPQARNAVDGPTAAALADAFRAFEADADCAVAILRGEGGQFCAGADLKAMHDPARRNRLKPEGDAPMGVTRMRLGKPVIAAIEGYCVAGGLELALWCDLRIAAEDAVFGVFCRRFGVPLIDGGTVRLPQLIGMSRAMDLILTGRPVAADEALAIGLVNRVVPAGSTLDAARELAMQLATFPQTCLRNDRRAVLEAADLPYRDAMAAEFELGMRTLESGESDAGAQRFANGGGRHGRFDAGGAA